MAATHDTASEGRTCCWCFAPTAPTQYNTSERRRRCTSVIKEWCCSCWCFPPTSAPNSAPSHVQPEAPAAASPAPPPQPPHENLGAASIAPRFSQLEEQDLKDKLKQLTMNDLDDLLLYIQAELNRLEPSSSNLVTRVLSECQKQTDVASCFVGTLPKNLTKEVSGASASFFLPLLKQALGGMGGVHWAGLGLSCIAWSLGNMDRTSQNHDNCLKLLRKVVSLLSYIRYLVGQQGIQDDQHSMQDLEVSTEIALRCAIICSSSLNQAYLARFFKAAKVEELISAMEAELNDAKVANIGIGVKAILEKMPKAHGPVTFTSRDEGIVGGDEEMQTVFDYLNKDGDVVAVCLHGMGGIGKSTRAFSVFKKFQAMGVYRCCRVGLELGTENTELPTFQWKILQQVCKGEIAKFSDVEEGKQKMETEFPKGGAIFLYVDNVMEEGHLFELLPNSTYFPHGSKILITTRNKRVFNDLKDLGIIKQYSECIEVEKLGKEAAEELFFRKVGRDSVGTQEEISTALNEVIELCDGLPLALKVVSSYIANMPMGRLELWREVVQKMRDAVPLDGNAKDRLYSRLDFSIHKLDPRFRTAFLDIVVFAIGSPWEFAERVVGMVELEGLFQRSLIQKRTLGNVYDTVVVEVHDVLLAKGRQMASHDHSEIRITNQQDFLKNIGSNDLERNIVGLSNIEIHGADLLQKMPSLRVLLDVDIVVECLTARLPHLKAIHIRESNVPRPMDFSACSGLKELELNVQDDFDLEDVLFRAGLEQLEALRLRSSSTSIDDLDLPQVMPRLKVIMPLKLKELKLSRFRNLQLLPERIGNLTGLKELVLLQCGSLALLPEGIRNLTGLKELVLRECWSLASLPEGIGNLTGLEELDLWSCVSLASLPEGIGNLTGLKELNLLQCESLSSLPEGIGNLTGLKELDLLGCESLTSLPEGIGNLTGLKELNLVRCESLTSLPKGIGNLTGLKVLNLRGCGSLTSLLEGIENLTGLEVLILEGCGSLTSLPEGIGNLTGLKELDLEGCGSLASLPEAIENLTGLKELRIQNCGSLASLPEGIKN